MLTSKILLLLASAFLVSAIGSGVFAGIASVSRKKGRLACASAVLMGLAIWTMQAADLLRHLSLPRFHVSGVILRTRGYTSGKSHWTQVLVRIDANAQAALNTQDRRPGYRVGEHIDAEYEGMTGDIISARFTSADGSPDGEDHHVIWVKPVILFWLGIYFMWSGFARYRRDPEGAVITARYANPDLSTAPDQASLLHLRDEQE